MAHETGFVVQRGHEPLFAGSAARAQSGENGTPCAGIPRSSPACSHRRASTSPETNARRIARKPPGALGTGFLVIFASEIPRYA